MRSQTRQNRAWLLTTAKAVAERLKLHSEGTRLRIRAPSSATTMDTDGWAAIIGDLGKNQPRLEVWFDRFSGYAERKLYAGFRSERRTQITSITNRVSRKLWPVRIVTTEDTNIDRHRVLNQRLARSEFNTPILEKYRRGQTFYGIYDPTRESSEKVSPNFCTRAVAFFEDVARALPQAALMTNNARCILGLKTGNESILICNASAAAFWRPNARSATNTHVKCAASASRTGMASSAWSSPKHIIVFL